MNTYKKFVSDLAKGHVDRVFLNSDEEHALIVFANLFKTAKDTIRIFAGCLCEHVGNESEYIEAISDFIERNGKIRILLNKFNENLIRESNLFKRLAYYKSEGHDIIIKKTTARFHLTKEPLKEVHFTVVDEIGYRIETDIEERTAECNFNSPALAKSIANSFDETFNSEHSELIDINKIINGN